MLSAVATGRWDIEEIELLALALDAKKATSPSIDIGWFQSFTEGLVSAEEVWEAARDELDLSEFED
jgi:hypothetical protein